MSRAARARESADARFIPSDPASIADPYPVYRELRERTPIVHHEPTNLWLISRYEDVDAVLRNRRFGRTYLHVAAHAEMGRPEEPEWLAPFWHVVHNGMLDLEPPDHTRLRGLVSKAFTPRTVERLRPRVQETVDALVDDVAGAGEFDLMARITEPLPVTVIAELLGVPESDRHLLRPWSADICGMYELNPSEEAGRTAIRAAVEFSEYLRALPRERRAKPRDDLITALGQFVEGGDLHGGVSRSAGIGLHSAMLASTPSRTTRPRERAIPGRWADPGPLLPPRTIVMHPAAR